MTAGVVVTALDTEEAASQHTAFQGTSQYSLLVSDGEQYYEFDLVRRTSMGRQHALTIAPVSAFGQWPLPPSELPMPARDDGSPLFEEGAWDSHGQRTYVPTGEYPREGFAIAPGTPSTDPAAGNPNWTWWEPLD